MFGDIKTMLKIIKTSKFVMNLVALLVIFILVYMGTAIVHKFVLIRNESRMTEQTLRDTIEVSGEGKIDVKPDVALISFGVVKESRSIATAQKENVEAMNQITKALKDLGIKENDLKTTNYSIYPRYEYDYKTGKRTLVAYEVSQNLEVKIRDFSKIGKAIQQAADLGANQIGGLNFTIDDEAKAKADARGKAIADAKAKARILAKQLGIKLGAIIDFRESGSYLPPIYRAQSMDMGGSGKAEEAPLAEIEPGTNEIQVNVELTYEIVH